MEAKAARIKDWVTNKLRELEDQNAQLKVQNAKANDQMELLQKRLEHIHLSGASTKSRQSSMAEVNIIRHFCLIFKHCEMRYAFSFMTDAMVKLNFSNLVVGRP